MNTYSRSTDNTALRNTPHEFPPDTPFPPKAYISANNMQPYPLHAWPQEDCANEPMRFIGTQKRDGFATLIARLTALLILAATSLLSHAAVREVGSIGLTVNSLDREVEFFTKVLPFEKISSHEFPLGEADELLGLTGTELRSTDLKLGGECITLTEHKVQKGQPIPADSRSFDHWFQHIAIVVRDMDQAYATLLQQKVKHVSTSPQTLPAWNKEAGGIKAFYFRDPEDHVLEIIWFPPGKGDPKWQRPTTNLFLGIDHTAIVVSDTDKSLAFYRDTLGMKVAGGAENYGVEQEHLNQVFGARLRITALRAGNGPGIEFLEYITPPGGRPLPESARSNDLVFWRTSLEVDGFDDLTSALHQRNTKFVSTHATELSNGKSSSNRVVIVRDPDGHALQFVERSGHSLRSSLTPQAKVE